MPDSSLESILNIGSISLVLQKGNKKLSAKPLYKKCSTTELLYVLLSILLTFINFISPKVYFFFFLLFSVFDALFSDNTKLPG